MPAVVRLGDASCGHGCFPPTFATEGSPNVFVNGKPVHRLGDRWVMLCCNRICQDGVASSGSATVFVNGKPMCRVRDSISCGDSMCQGSSNVFAG